MQTFKYESVFRLYSKGIEFNGHKWSLDNTDNIVAIRPKTLKDIAVYYPLVIKLLDETVGFKDEIAISLPVSLYTNIDARSDILTRIWKETGKQAIAYPSGVLNLLNFQELDGKVLLMDIGYSFVNFSLISNLKPLYMKTLPLGIKHIKSEITEYLTYLTYRVRREIETIKEKEDKLILVGGIKHLSSNALDDEFSNVKAISLQSELQSIDFGTAFIKCMK
jgi:hypothetical protein